MPESVLVTRQETVSIITIQRPEVRNALDDQTMIAIREALVACEDDGTRCIVLTGAGGTFSSGADLKKAVTSGISPQDRYRLLVDVYGPTLKAIRAASWPVIAAVDGYAAGIGCDMALACDLRLVSERGKFAELFIRIGLIPDGGGTYLLPRLVGAGRAMEMLLTGRDVEAQEALQIGLANRVLPVEGFMEQVLEFAGRISQQSPKALQYAKKALIASLDSNYDEALTREAEFQRELLQSEDSQEGILAFFEKRAPVWKGK
jgi:2-(1,2-epoxy-1,2-dihydrophenyl)acetyl-CoA isomerase